MPNLIDRNLYESLQPPFHLCALYLVHAAGADGEHLKVGSVDVQSVDVGVVLQAVQRRVRAAVPSRGASRRIRVRPPTRVWVVLTPNPTARHELELAVVDRFGHRRFDPMRLRRREFLDPDKLRDVFELIDQWRGSMRNVYSETLVSEDGGRSYRSPRRLLPYADQTPMGKLPTELDDVAHLVAGRRHVPQWRERRLVVMSSNADRASVVPRLMHGHHRARIRRLMEALEASPVTLLSAAALGRTLR